MKIIISSDSFKGSTSTMSAAEQIEEGHGILTVFSSPQIRMVEVVKT